MQAAVLDSDIPTRMLADLDAGAPGVTALTVVAGPWSRLDRKRPLSSPVFASCYNLLSTTPSSTGG